MQVTLGRARLSEQQLSQGQRIGWPEQGGARLPNLRMSGHRSAGEHHPLPLTEHGIAAVHGANKGAANRRIRVRVAAGADGLDDRIL